MVGQVHLALSLGQAWFFFCVFSKLEPKVVRTHWGVNDYIVKAATANRTLKDMATKGAGQDVGFTDRNFER